MSSDGFATLTLSTSVWLAFGWAILTGHPVGPSGAVWVSTSSERVASHPTLVRANGPIQLASR
jgi:hypothetical protein